MATFGRIMLVPRRADPQIKVLIQDMRLGVDRARRHRRAAYQARQIESIFSSRQNYMHGRFG